MGVKRRSVRRDAEPEEVDVFEDESAGVEALLIRIADGKAQVSLPPPECMGSPEMWGYLLCEAMLHIANAYRLIGHYPFEPTLDRIYAGLQNRLQHDLTLYGTAFDN